MLKNHMIKKKIKPKVSILIIYSENQKNCQSFDFFIYNQTHTKKQQITHSINPTAFLLLYRGKKRLNFDSISTNLKECF
jgi:hypothetical protein